MQPDVAKEFNLGTGTISSLQEVIDDPEYMENEANVRVKDQYQYQYLQYANSVGPVQDMDFVKKTMLDTFDKSVAGELTTEEALSKMEKDINAHIDELRAQAK